MLASLFPFLYSVRTVKQDVGCQYYETAVAAPAGNPGFPGMIINLDVGRDRSIRAVESAMNMGKRILLVTQRSAEENDPTAKSLYNFGVIAEIKQMLKLPNGAMRILVEGLTRVEVISVVDAVGMNLEAYVAEREDVNDHSNEVEALKRMLVETFEQWVLASKK